MAEKSMCVCVCVSERDKEKEREREREKGSVVRKGVCLCCARLKTSTQTIKSNNSQQPTTWLCIQRCWKVLPSTSLMWFVACGFGGRPNTMRRQPSGRSAVLSAPATRRSCRFLALRARLDTVRRSGEWLDQLLRMSRTCDKNTHTQTNKQTNKQTKATRRNKKYTYNNKDETHQNYHCYHRLVWENRAQTRTGAQMGERRE